MNKRLLMSVGGPFPFDRAFKGQAVVEWDYINSALKSKFTSHVVALDYKRGVSGYRVFEQQQKSIARKAFNSTLAIRRDTDLEGALKSNEWGKFFGIDELERHISKGTEAHCVMHYYNARFRDGVNALEAAKAYGSALDGAGHYVLHVNPDQLVLDNLPFEQWTKSDEARIMVGRLGEIVESSFFKSLIAVSQSARQMWLRMLEGVGACDIGLAKRKIKAVPNGTDTDLYKVFPKPIREEVRRDLGFTDDVEKVVLIMTRPSASKGVWRVGEVMRIFNDSTDNEMKRVGFVVALPETGAGTRNFLSRISAMENLIREGRVKVTIDVSKVVRGDASLLDDIEAILREVPLSYSGAPFYVPPVRYPLTHAADVFLHLPKAEAFGLVVSEALLSGCGVVTTDAGGIPEVVKNAGAQAQVLDHASMKANDAVDAVMKSNREEKPNREMIGQFSINGKIDEVMGDA